MYEHYLLNEPKHVQARFNLAKLYEKRLDDARKARMHYQALKGFLSPSHPFYHEVLDFLKKHVTT
jgi:hypothetical protein